MTPLFGILFGVWILSEPIEDSFMFGAVMVMIGIVLVNAHEKIKNKLKLYNLELKVSTVSLDNNTF